MDLETVMSSGYTRKLDTKQYACKRNAGSFHQYPSGWARVDMHCSEQQQIGVCMSHFLLGVGALGRCPELPRSESLAASLAASSAPESFRNIVGCHGANLNTIVPSAMAAALQREVPRSRAKTLSISLELTAPVAVPLR